MDLKLTREMSERRAVRHNLVKGADRSEKIRTYNFAQVCSVLSYAVHLLTWVQNRVTDHRVGLTVKNLESVMEGTGLIDIVDHLKRDHDETQLKDVLAD